MGDAHLGTHNTAPGTALPVAVDYVDAAGAVWRTVQLPRNASGGRAPCTLSYGDVGATSTSWWLETEGLPSRASQTRDVVLLPCHGSPAGARFTDLVRDAKTIATVGAAAARDDVATLPFEGYTGVRGTGSGLRQAASLDGRSGFWVAGIAASRYGVRHVARGGGGNSTRVHGSTFYSSEPLRHQPATLDVRGLGLYGPRLLLSSSYLVERNRNMPTTSAWRGWTPWGGVVLVGDDAAAPPVTAQAASVLVRGFPGRRNYWTFVFEGDHSLWLLEDTARYAAASHSQAASFDARLAGARAAAGQPALLPGGSLATRPVHVRTTVGTAVVHWVWRGAAWGEDVPARAPINDDACYSLAGRDEGGATGWVVYTTSRTALYRVVTATRAVTVVARAPAGTLYRGVVLPPFGQRSGAAAQPLPASLSSADAPEAPPPSGASPAPGATTRTAAPAAATRTRTPKPRL